jgi:hypothetical protein
MTKQKELCSLYHKRACCYHAYISGKIDQKEYLSKVLWMDNRIDKIELSLSDREYNVVFTKQVCSSG